MSHMAEPFNPESFHLDAYLFPNPRALAAGGWGGKGSTKVKLSSYSVNGVRIPLVPVLLYITIFVSLC